MKKSTRYLLPLVLLFILSGCATINIPEGGEKDVLAPEVIRSYPDSMAVNFLSKELSFEFDEYFTVNDFQKQFLITPSFDKQITYTVKGKRLIIKLPEYPKINTTYQVYFGNSIKDLNEGNTLKNFHRIFSTGSNIDSSSIPGKISWNGLDPGKENNLKIFLYQNLSDSTLLFKKPTYVTFPDQTGNFNFSHLKAGSYYVAALNDLNNNYLLDQGEQIGISFEPIHTDSISVQLDMFQNDERDSSFQLRKIIQKDKLNYIAILRSTLLNPTVQLRYDFSSPIYFDPLYTRINPSGDSLFITNSTAPSADSIEVLLKHGDSTIRSTFHLRGTPKNHELKLSVPSTFNSPQQPIILHSSYPLTLAQLKDLQIIDKLDSTKVEVSRIESKDLDYIIHPTKSLREMGRFAVIPNLVDLDTTFNSIHYKPDTLYLSTSSSTNTGSIEFSLKNNTDHPLIVQLIKNNKVLHEFYTQQDTLIKSKYLDPGTYMLQAIIDRDHNKRYTTGSLRLRRQPEMIRTLSKNLEVKNDWMIRDLNFEVD